MPELQRDILLGAVADVLAEERNARLAACRELAAELARSRERIDEYGNVIDTKFLALDHRMSAAIADRVASLGLKNGEPGPAGPAGDQGPPGPEGPPGLIGPMGERGADAYCGMARGRWNAEATYRAMDVVALNGSEWRAVRDDPGPLPGDGWMLGAKGHRGDKGERGAVGPAGPAGPPGRTEIRHFKMDGWKLIIEFNDGRWFACDLFPMFERYHQEMAA